MPEELNDWLPNMNLILSSFSARAANADKK